MELTIFQIDKESGKPISAQLVDCVLNAIEEKKLLPGDRLPTERSLAESFGIARGTVKTAYRKLAQIRQDLNNFGGFGQQGYGYNVNYLYDEIAKILGINRQHNLIIVGAGNLGQAIANYANFEKRGFVIKGMFDSNPRLIGLVVRGVEIRSVEDLETFVKDNEVQIAALTIPKTKAPELADRLVKAGIKAIWNFAHTDLNVPEDVVVENVHLSESLMRLSYRICRHDQEEENKE